MIRPKGHSVMVRDMLVAFFAANPDELLSVADAVAKFGVNAHTVHAAVHRMRKTGLLRAEGHGRTAPKVLGSGPELDRLLGRAPGQPPAPPPRPTLPPGWQAVPVRTTAEMRAACRAARAAKKLSDELWRDMLAVAPALPADTNPEAAQEREPGTGPTPTTTAQGGA